MPQTFGTSRSKQTLLQTVTLSKGSAKKQSFLGAGKSSQTSRLFNQTINAVQQLKPLST